MTLFVCLLVPELAHYSRYASAKTRKATLSRRWRRARPSIFAFESFECAGVSILEMLQNHQEDQKKMNSGVFRRIGSTRAVFWLIALFAGVAGSVFATNNHEYGPFEYVVINGGLSPDHKYSLAAHGEGDLGYENFHIYLMNAVTGKKIGPLEEIKDTLDTAAGAFSAKWSRNSAEVAIRYRIDRREAVEVRYRIAKGRAYRLKGPSKVDGPRND